MSENGGSYEHWQDSASANSPVPIEGFDSANGLRQYEYEPADGSVKAPAPPSSANEKKKRGEKSLTPKQPVQYVYQMSPPQSQQPMMYYPQMPYTCYIQGAIPAPAYYGIPPQAQGWWCSPAMPSESGYACVEPPIVAEQEVKPKDDGEKDKKAENKDKQTKKVEATKWQGRTKAEVKDDDMIIAKKEGAFEKRKIVPVGLNPNQPVWVVTSDSQIRLRTLAEAQEMKGEWHEDPRFKGSLYLVCEKEDVKEEKKAPKKGGKKEKQCGGEGKKCTCEK